MSIVINKSNKSFCSKNRFKNSSPNIKVNQDK